MSLAQSSTDSTRSNVIILDGQRYVLVPEKTFSKIEKLTDEVPALRTESAALRAEKANADTIIRTQTELVAAKDRIIEAQAGEATALRRALDAERESKAQIQKALDISKEETARQERRAKKWRKVAVVAAAVSVFGWIL